MLHIFRGITNNFFELFNKAGTSPFTRNTKEQYKTFVSGHAPVWKHNTVQPQQLKSPLKWILLV